MKKLYFLMFALLASAFSYGQVIKYQDFEGGSDDWAYTETPATYNVSSDTWAIVTSLEGSVGTPQSGTSFWGMRDLANPNGGTGTGEPSTLAFDNVDVSGQTDVSVSFYYFTDGYDTSDSIQVEVFFDDVSQGVEDLLKDTDAWTQYIKAVPSGTNNVRLTIIAIQDGGSDYAGVDNFKVESGAVVSPSLTITAPTEGQEFNPETTALDVTFVVQNFVVATIGNGDGHIHYNVDGGSDVMKYDTDPISLTGLSSGAHSVYMELVDDNHQPLSPAVNQTVNFSIASYTDVANLAELRAGTIGQYYRVTGEVYGTYAQNYRNQKWVQDATAGIVIDDYAGVVTTTYNEGDGVINLRGKLGEYNGNMQLVPSADPGVNSTGNVITPQVVTIADLAANNEDYESELVQIDGNVTFVDADGTATFATGTVYAINGGADTYNMRTSFYDADYIGAVIPTGNVTMIGIIGERSGNTYFITPRDQTSDLLGYSQQPIVGFELFPNPVNNGIINITTKDNLDKNIQIFNVLGKQIFATTISGTSINVSSLNSGIYIIRVEEAGRLATRKLVIE